MAFLIIVGVIVGVIVLVGILLGVSDYQRNKEIEQKQITEDEEIKNKIVKGFSEIMKAYSITEMPENADIVYSGGLKGADACVWKQNNHIYICTEIDSLCQKIIDNHIFRRNVRNCETDSLLEKRYNEIMYGLKPIIININEVKFYKVDGEILTRTEMSGGKVIGGGTSIGGAVVGGLLAGDVGAIIGSRKKIVSEPIRTNTINDDKRVVNVYIETDDMVKVFQYEYPFFEVFQKYMPEKSFDYISINKSLC